MLNRCIFWIFFVFSLFLAQTVRAEPIGTIVEIEGTVTVAHGGGAAKPAKINDEIELKDVIATGASSRAFILLVDDTEWTLSENTRFAVSDYVFNPDDTADNKARYSVIEGAFRYVSGLVAKRENPDVSISTPVGSIGIRGTDFWGGRDETGEYGVYVDEGSVNVQTLGGAALLKRGEGTSVRDRKSAPARPGAWKKERIQHMRGSVFLKRQGELKERRAKLRARQTELREKLKTYFQQRKEKRGGMNEKWQDKRETRKETFEAMKDKREERQENWQDKKGQWQETHPAVPPRRRWQKQ